MGWRKSSSVYPHIKFVQQQFSRCSLRFIEDDTAILIFMGGFMSY